MKIQSRVFVHLPLAPREWRWETWKERRGAPKPPVALQSVHPTLVRHVLNQTSEGPCGSSLSRPVGSNQRKGYRRGKSGARTSASYWVRSAPIIFALCQRLRGIQKREDEDTVIRMCYHTLYGQLSPFLRVIVGSLFALARVSSQILSALSSSGKGIWGIQFQCHTRPIIWYAQQ